MDRVINNRLCSCLVTIGDDCLKSFQVTEIKIKPIFNVNEWSTMLKAKGYKQENDDSGG